MDSYGIIVNISANLPETAFLISEEDNLFNDPLHNTRKLQYTEIETVILFSNDTRS